jgi:hypothetical protein
MPDDPSVDQLRSRQLKQERAEREALSDADSQADAERHRRRADKARYLREKLEQRARADQEAATEDD